VRRFALLLFLMFGPSPALGQELVTDMSSTGIELRHSFTGATLTLFGAIKSSPRDLDQTAYDVVLVVKGAPRAFTVRKKERVLGIWVNAKALTFAAAPGYYSVASTRPLAEIANPPILAALKIGAQHHFTGPSREISADELEAFIAGFIENRRRAGLYRSGDDRMEIRSGTLFKADFFFPSNVPSGAYEATAYLFRKGRMLSETHEVITVGTIGFERTIFTLAYQYPALYGLLAVILAIGFGWAATVVIQKRTTLG
jgi:uncharacterized protein (TIGR02186 family)